MHPSAQNQRLIQPLMEWIRTTIRHCDSVYLFGSAHSQENTMKQLPTDLNASVLQNTVPLSDFQNQVSSLSPNFTREKVWKAQLTMLALCCR